MENLQRVAATFIDPFTNDVWERSRRRLAALMPATDFLDILQQNRNKVAERFFDGAGSLHVVLFDRDEHHWHHALPAASAAVYSDLAVLALCHGSRPRNIEDSAFLHILVTQMECLFTRDPCVPRLAPIPPTPSETTEDSDDGGPQQMDVDAANIFASEPDPVDAGDEIPESVRQIRFLQRHNASRLENTATQSDFPWAGHVE